MYRKNILKFLKNLEFITIIIDAITIFLLFFYKILTLRYKF